MSYDVPPSLEDWVELNRLADEAELREDFVEWERLGEEIETAWYAAPLRDRVRVDWELLKQVWRDRNKAL